MEANPLSYHFGEFTLDTGRGCVLKAGSEIKLRPKVFETLKYLVEHPRTASRQEGTDASGVAVTASLPTIRWCSVRLSCDRALDDGTQQLLKTVPRRGYVFNAAVIRHPPDDHRATASFDLSAGQEMSSATIGTKRNDLPVPRTSLSWTGEQQVTEATTLLLRQEHPAVEPLPGRGRRKNAHCHCGRRRDCRSICTAGIQFVSLASITWQPDLVVQRLLPMRSRSSKLATAPFPAHR